MSGRRRVALHGTIIAACIVIGALLSLARGQDTNFDQLNYHFYSAYAYATGRIGHDVAPGQVMHSFLSPIVYLPFYAMVRHLPPRVVGMALGALHGLNLWLVFVIARIVTRGLPPSARLAATLAAVAISAASPMAVSELGTSMTDLLVSLPVLAGVALLLHADLGGERRVRSIAAIALAGALLGAATSLKLTAAAFAIGLAAAAPVGRTGWRDRIAALLATGAGGVAGFAAAGGWWYLAMWRLFANPVFPYFNAIFRSPDYPSATSLFDAHYIPHGVLQALSYPFLWVRTQTTTTEIPFRDIRFALLVLLGIVVLAVRLSLRERAPGASTPAGRRLVTCFIVAFCVWLYEWSIQRYLVSLELLAGPAIIVLLLWSGCFAVPRDRWLAMALAALAAVCVLTVRTPNWGHLGWRTAWYEVNVPPPGSANPLYFLVSEPLSYIVPELPPGATAIEVIPWEIIPNWGDTVFLRRIHALVADPNTTAMWAVGSGPFPDSFAWQIAAYGVKLDGPCHTGRGRPLPLTWCPVVRVTH